MTSYSVLRWPSVPPSLPPGRDHGSTTVPTSPPWATASKPPTSPRSSPGFRRTPGTPPRSWTPPPRWNSASARSSSSCAARRTRSSQSACPRDGYRHAGQWSFTDAAEVLASDAPTALSTLTRPQRLTIADELAADAAERASAAQVLASGNDPESEDSRAWQMCEVTRTLRNGQVGPLPEGAASWLVRSWGPDLGPAERWAARDRLVRIEQLVAACEAHGGRAGAQDDPLLAHLVVPRPGPDEDDEVIYVSVHPGTRNSWGTSPAAAMTVTSYRGTAHPADRPRRTRSPRRRRVRPHPRPVDPASALLARQPSREPVPSSP